jgi:hypothetical protein
MTPPNNQKECQKVVLRQSAKSRRKRYLNIQIMIVWENEKYHHEQFYTKKNDGSNCKGQIAYNQREWTTPPILSSIALGHLIFPSYANINMDVNTNANSTWQCSPHKIVQNHIFKFKSHPKSWFCFTTLNSS